jgi:Fe-S cluster assembly ATP-binding protein
MSREQQVRDALVDLDCAVAAGADIDESIHEIASTNDLKPEVLRMRAEKAFGSLQSLAARGAAHLALKNEMDTAFEPLKRIIEDIVDRGARLDTAWVSYGRWIRENFEAGSETRDRAFDFAKRLVRLHQIRARLPNSEQNPMLQINNLHAVVGGTEILKGLTLSLNAGEIHAIMGPNGAGKSTLAYVLGGRPGYEVTEGSVSFTSPLPLAGGVGGGPDASSGAGRRRIDLLALAPHERAAAGLFLGFQYPVEIPGVSNVQFLRESLNAQRKARGEEPLSGGDFLKLARAQADAMGMDMEMLKRPVNVGFSGGEKKRNEMVQMGIIDPKLAILDETDSGLDIDALRVVGDGINRIMRRPDKAVLLITHYQRLLDYVKPDFVHVLADGKIVRSGGPELALELEREGYRELAA